MMDCVSVANMRYSDEMTIQGGVSSIELIRRAAYGVYCSVEWKSDAAIVCGSGNNGADGFALACILQSHSIPCTVFTVSERLHEDAAYYAAQAADRGVSARPYVQGCLRGYGIIVDCMLGTGFCGTPRLLYKQAMKEINAMDSYVVSVDINSGMNGDTGAVDTAVVSDLTVAIGFVKNGQVLPSAEAYMKRLICVDVGIGLAVQENKICTHEEWAALRSERGSVDIQSCTLDGVCYFHCPRWLDMNVKKCDWQLH